LERKNKIIIVGHMGRPEGFEDKFSLKPVYLELMGILEKDCGGDCVRNIFIENINDEEKIKEDLETNEILFVENLRFNFEEEVGDTSLFKVLKKYAKVYVNDAFAVAHRAAASIILYREMESYYGLDFMKEVEAIGQILNKDNLVIVLGGAKEDKLKYLSELEKVADYILIGGKLPKIIKEKNKNVLVAELRKDGLDLSDEDIKKFKEKIKEAKIIVWAGAMGFYEKENCQKGTEEIAKSVAKSDGYKIIAGGDTLASVKNLGLEDNIDFVCSGGGVMLEMLIKDNLPAWE